MDEGNAGSNMLMCLKSLKYIAIQTAKAVLRIRCKMYLTGSRDLHSVPS